MAKRTIKTKALSSAAELPTFDPAKLDAALIQAAKTHYQATVEDGPQTTLDDAGVWAAIVATHNKYPDTDKSGDGFKGSVVDEMLDAEDDDDDETSTDVSINKVQGWIKEAAAILNKDPEIINQMQELIKAEDTRKRGPVVLFNRFLNDLAKSQEVSPGHVTYNDCAMDDWAEPLSYNENGTETTLVNGKYFVGSGANKREFINKSNSARRMDKFTRLGGDNKPKQASSYMDMALCLDIGIAIARERDLYKAGTNKDLPFDKASNPYKALGPKACEDEFVVREGRLKTLAGQIRLCKNMWDQWRTLQDFPLVYPKLVKREVPIDINDLSKGVRQELTPTQRGIAVVQKSDPAVYETYGASGFNALNLAKAKADGGTWLAVTSSVKKKGKKKGGGKDTGAGSANAPAQGSVVNWQINDFRSAMIGEMNFIDNPSNAISARQAMRAAPEHSDELLQAAGRVFLFLHNTLGDAELCTRLDTLFKEKPGTFANILEGNVSTKNSGTIGKAA